MTENKGMPVVRHALKETLYIPVTVIYAAANHDMPEPCCKYAATGIIKKQQGLINPLYSNFHYP